MELIFIVVFIALLFAVWSAHTKINNLEKRLDLLAKPQNQTTQQVTAENPSDESFDVEPPVAPIPVPMAGLMRDEQPSVPIPPPSLLYKDSSSPATASEPFFLLTWFKEHTLIKIGSIIFFFGAAWFVTYAFDQNWIPPMARVLMGLALAGVIYFIGFARRPVEVAQYIVLTALGSGVVFATVLSAQFVLDSLLPEMVSLVLLLGAIAYTLWVSYETDAEWLAITAAVAALFAPQFTGSDPSSAIPFLSYLFVISAGFGAVVLATAWRYVSLTLVVGSSIYLLNISLLSGQKPVVWFFAVLFSILFLALTSGSVLRNRVPLFIDGVTLLLTGLLFAYFVHTHAIMPALASFAAAAVTATVGYLARQRETDPAAVLLFAATSIVGLFAGTAYLFDGFTATFFFAVESATLIFMAMKFAFLKRTIMLASSTLIIPFVLGIDALFDSVWDMGLIHAPALASLAVSLCFVSVGTYMYLTAERATLPWLSSLARVTLFSWYGYTTMLLIVVARTLANLSNGDILPWMLVLLLAFSVVITIVTFSRVGLRNFTLWTYVLPIGTALGVLIQSGSEEVFSVADILVSSVMLVVLLLITSVYGLVSKENQSNIDAVSSYTFLWLSFLFSSSWLMILLGTVFSAGLTLTLSSVAIAALAYGVVNILLRLDIRFDWISPFVIALFVPVVGLMPSLSLDGWDDGVLSVDAVSLYAYITMAILLGVTLYRYALDRSSETAKALSSALFIVGGILSFVLVWIITHTISGTPAVAVTIALFVYTILGLLSYVYGKRMDQIMFIRAGYLLLTAVVVRLAIIDVWDMDPFWRIVTFLGIGALFIVAALLERKPEVLMTDQE